MNNITYEDLNQYKIIQVNSVPFKTYVSNQISLLYGRIQYKANQNWWNLNQKAGLYYLGPVLYGFASTL